MTFSPSGDSQIWRFVDGGRSVPVLAVRGEYSKGECYRVRTALALDAAPADFLIQRLDEIAFHKDMAHWYVRPAIFEAAAVFCKGITPAYWLQWSPPPTEAVPTPAVSTTSTTSSEVAAESPDYQFIRAACAEYGIPNPKATFATWMLLNQYALTWLLDHQRPLNLGWCQIDAFPYRANWQQIITSRYADGLPDACRLPSSERDIVLQVAGVAKSLCSPWLMAVPESPAPRNSPTYHFSWSLAITPTPSFTTVTEEREQRAAQNLKPYEYLQRYLDLLDRSRHRIIATLASWLEQTAQAIGDVDWNLGPHRRRLLRRLAKGRVAPAPFRVPPTRFCNLPSGHLDPLAATQPDAAPVEEVQTVPDADLTLHLRPARRMA